MTPRDSNRLRPTRLPGWLTGSGVIAVGMGVMNLTTYGFTVVAARMLGPREYGGLAAVMGLLLIVNVVSLGLQATAARRVSAFPEDLVGTEHAVIQASVRAATVLFVVSCLAAPLVTAFVRLDGWAPALLLAVTGVPLTLMGAQAGVLQGERRWAALAGVYVAVGVARIVLGVLGMLWRPDVTGAMLGVAVGAVLPTMLGWWVLRRGPGARTDLAATPAGRGVLAEVAHNSHAMLAFFALSNADVVVARSVLGEHQSGLYAGGLILAKAVLFLPQFVAVIAFPSLAAGEGRRLEAKALAAVLGIGALATLATAVLRNLATVFVGGSDYAELAPSLWAFAAVGTLLAMQQLMVYGAVARQHRAAVAVLWTGLAALLGLSRLAGSLEGLLAVVAGVHTVVVVLLVALSAPRRASSPPSPPTRRAGR